MNSNEKIDLLQKKEKTKQTKETERGIKKKQDLKIIETQEPFIKKMKRFACLYKESEGRMGISFNNFYNAIASIYKDRAKKELNRETLRKFIIDKPPRKNYFGQENRIIIGQIISEIMIEVGKKINIYRLEEEWDNESGNNKNELKKIDKETSANKHRIASIYCEKKNKKKLSK